MNFNVKKEKYRNTFRPRKPPHPQFQAGLTAAVLHLTERYKYVTSNRIEGLTEMRA